MASMTDCYLTESKEPIVPIRPIIAQQLPSWLSSQNQLVQNWIHACGFDGRPDWICSIPDSTGQIQLVLLGVNPAGSDQFWHFGGLPLILPKGVYQISRDYFATDDHHERALLAFGLGAYQFNAYRDNPAFQAKLLIADSKKKNLSHWLSTIYLIRDLINTPTEDMGPGELAEAVIAVGEECDASVTVIRGDDLLTEGFAAIHAVGRAGSRPPCLIDLQWGDVNAPKITLVGKGVCFDSGGLDLKSAAGMLLMKKDMAGAAHALGLARLIMLHRLPVCLRVLIPAVENAVGSLSYRPGDVLTMHSGLSVEVTNTDAEGRLVLADALSLAVQDRPDFLCDFATLTGAARQALGPQLPAFFCNQESLASHLLTAAEKTRDLFWRLPLYQPYEIYLKSEVADMANSSIVPMAGAVTAALFLKRFVPDQIPWAHFDLFAWNNEPLPGRPVGGEAMTVRAVFDYLQERFK